MKSKCETPVANVKYALRRKDNPHSFYYYGCVASTKEDLEAKINQAYWNWKGTQQQGNQLTIDDFMRDRERIKMVIEVI